MHKLIPTIYFYVVSLIGLVLLIIGIFASTHFLAGIIFYDTYPLGYTAESRCMPAAFAPGTVASTQSASVTGCLQDVEKEIQERKVADAEKAVSFTLIGLIIFAIHFYYAKKQK